MVETFMFHFFYITDFYLHYLRASLLAQMVKNTSAVRETAVGSQTWEDPLEKGTITHSSILAWRIPKKKKKESTFEWRGCLQSLIPGQGIKILHVLGQLSRNTITNEPGSHYWRSPHTLQLEKAYI